jgi:hypothetical protein
MEPQMGDYVLGVLGILVSVGLFFVGYRQTVGAKKERIINANSETEKILVRRIVLENYDPTSADINRLLEGKARDFRVKVGDLYSDTQLLTNIFTRILESDFIPQSQREDILARLSTILEQAESTPIQEEELEDLPSSSQHFITKTALPMMMAMMASVLGGLIAIVPDLRNMDINVEELFPVLIVVTLLSFFIIITFFFFNRIKESQESTTYSSRSKRLREYLDFEKQVSETLNKSGAKLSPASLRDRRYDFKAETGSKSMIIVVKYTSTRMPTSVATIIIENLVKAVKTEGTDEGILVVNRPPEVPEDILKNKPIKILTVKQLKFYVSKNKSI